jgi:hypothetical protein
VEFSTIVLSNDAICISSSSLSRGQHPYGLGRQSMHVRAYTCRLSPYWSPSFKLLGHVMWKSDESNLKQHRSPVVCSPKGLVFISAHQAKGPLLGVELFVIMRLWTCGFFKNRTPQRGFSKMRLEDISDYSCSTLPHLITIIVFVTFLPSSLIH